MSRVRRACGIFAGSDPNAKSGYGARFGFRWASEGASALLSARCRFGSGRHEEGKGEVVVGGCVHDNRTRGGAHEAVLIVGAVFDGVQAGG
jgi:hypothetical protein